MDAKDVMTTEVIWIDVTATVWDAFLLMRKHNVSGLPVRGLNGELVGIITEGDILRDVRSLHLPEHMRALESLISAWKSSHYEESVWNKAARPISEVMNAPVITVGERADIGEVVQIMLEEKINRVPVVRGKEVVGMISRSDILRALVDYRK